jgi:Membrane protein involved in the export of O-antigen and teichoic acid
MIQSLLGRLKALRTVEGRERSIVLSISTSTGNKVLGLITQLVTFPIAVHALGERTFSTYIMLSSVLAWLSISSIGIGPALTRAVLVETAAGNREREAQAFGTAMWLALGAGAVLLLLGLLVFVTGLVQPEQVLGISKSGVKAGPDEISALAVSAILVVVTVVTSVTEGARGGYLEQYKSNIYLLAASAISIVALLIVAWAIPTLTAMCLAVYGATALGRIGNTFALVAVERPYLWPRFGHFRAAMAKELTESSITFAIVTVCALVVIQGPTLLVGWSLGAGAATPIGVMINMEMLFGTIVFMITAPLWPAITDAHARQDIRWIERAQKRLLSLVLLYAGGVGLGIALFGNSVVSIWLGGKVHVSAALQIGMGLYFPLWMVTHSFHTLLVGLGRLWWAMWSLCVYTGVAGIVGYALVPSMGGAGMGIALCVGAASSLPVYWRYTRLAIRAPVK